MARGVHLVLLVLAALVCVEYIYVCVVGLGAHLVLSVLAALVVCVGYMCCGAWSAPGTLSACCTCRMCWLYVLWCLERTWCCQCLLHLYICWLYVKWGAWRAPDARGEWPL